jgi:hypothetical protein
MYLELEILSFVPSFDVENDLVFIISHSIMAKQI